MALDYPDGIHLTSMSGKKLDVYCGIDEKVFFHIDGALFKISDETVQDLITWMMYHQLWRKENE